MDWLKEAWENLTKPVNFKAPPKEAVKKAAQRPGSASYGQKGTYGIGQGYTTDRAPGNFFEKAAVARGAKPLTNNAPSQNNFFNRATAQAASPIPRNVAPQPNIRQAMERDNPATNRGLNISSGPSMPVGGGEIFADPTGGMDDEFSSILEGIRGKLDQEYQGIDPAVRQMLEGAFASQFGAIDKARGTAQGNYEQSDDRLEDLYAGHVSDIQNVDSERYKGITNDWKGGIQSGYDSAINAASADRTAESERLAALMQLNGLQGSGSIAGESAGILSEGIQGMQADKAGAVSTADTYGSADLSRNVARGQAVASQGAANRADLMQQLQGILGSLDNKRVDIEQDKSMAFIEADQQSRAAFNDERELNVNSLAQLLDQRSAETAQRQEQSWRQEDRNFALEDRNYERQSQESDRAFERERMIQDAVLQREEMAAKNGGAAGGGSIFQQILGPLGANPEPWRNAYSDWTADSNYNTLGGVPLNKELSEYFKKKGLDPALAPEVAIALEKLGTRKYE